MAKRVVGDFGPSKPLVIKAHRMDLAAATIRILVRKPNGTSVVWIPVATDVLGKRVLYHFQKGDLDQAGEYQVQLEVLKAGDTDATSSSISRFPVMAKLAA